MDTGKSPRLVFIDFFFRFGFLFLSQHLVTPLNKKKEGEKSKWKSLNRLKVTGISSTFSHINVNNV